MKGYTSVGDCISDRYASECSGLKSDEREGCVHDQQEYCKNLMGMESDEIFQLISFGKDHTVDTEEDPGGKMDHDIVFQGNLFISLPE